ncbi:MAG TPA: hypothetical protein VFG89_06545 [Coriobacteriia bacterium]|nr:hypothetical protein [Coriobacteriia bacterium]
MNQTELPRVKEVVSPHRLKGAIMLRRYWFVIALVAVLALGATGCTAQQPTPEPSQPVQTPTEQPGGAAGGDAGAGAAGDLMPAPGFYEQADNRVMVIGVLTYKTIEGGFWAVIDKTGISGPKGAVLAVIANIQEDNATYKALAGTQVVVTGTKAGGVSIRQAGPEIEATDIQPYGSGGPAQ